MLKHVLIPHVFKILQINFVYYSLCRTFSAQHANAWNLLLSPLWYKRKADNLCVQVAVTSCASTVPPSATVSSATTRTPIARTRVRTVWCCTPIGWRFRRARSSSTSLPPQTRSCRASIRCGGYRELSHRTKSTVSKTLAYDVTADDQSLRIRYLSDWRHVARRVLQAKQRRIVTSRVLWLTSSLARSGHLWRGLRCSVRGPTRIWNVLKKGRGGIDKFLKSVDWTE